MPESSAIGGIPIRRQVPGKKKKVKRNKTKQKNKTFSALVSTDIKYNIELRTWMVTKSQ